MLLLGCSKKKKINTSTRVRNHAKNTGVPSLGILEKMEKFPIFITAFRIIERQITEKKN